MPILLEDIYNLVTFDPELRLVKQVRSNERIPSLQELHRSYTSLVKSFELYTRHVFLAAGEPDVARDGRQHGHVHGGGRGACLLGGGEEAVMARKADRFPLSL